MNTGKTRQIDFDDILFLAKEAAISGAEIHRKGFEKDVSAQTKTSELDLVCEIDIEAEKVIARRILRKHDRTTRLLVKKAIIIKETAEFVG